MIKCTILQLFSIFQNKIVIHSLDWGIPVRTRKRSNMVEVEFDNGSVVELVELRDQDGDVEGYSINVCEHRPQGDPVVGRYHLLSIERYHLLDPKYYA
jgi:hypothetical protein